MSDLKKWYLGGMVVAADKSEFKEEEHPRGKGGMFVKKGEQKDDGKLTGADFTFNEKNGVVTVLAPENVNVGQDVRKKMIDEINRKYPNKEFSFSKFSNGVSDGIKAVAVKGEGGVGSSALEEVYKKGGFKNPDALAKADFEELGKMSDSRLDAEITMLKGRVEESGKPLDKARLEAAEGIMKGRGEKKADTKGKIEGNGEESLKKAISELSDERLDIALKNGERNAKRDDLSEEQRQRYANTLPYLKAEKEKRKNVSEDTTDSVKAKISSAMKAYENAKTFKTRAEAARVVSFNACKLSSVDKSANEGAMKDYVKLNFDNDSERARYEKGLTKYDENVVYDAMKHLGKEKALNIVNEVCNSGKYLFFKSPLSDRPHIGYADMKENMNRRNFSYDAYNDFMKDFEERASK